MSDDILRKLQARLALQQERPRQISKFDPNSQVPMNEIPVLDQVDAVSKLVEEQDYLNKQRLMVEAIFNGYQPAGQNVSPESQVNFLQKRAK